MGVTCFVTGSLTCSVGILVLPASVAGDITSLLACQMLDSSSPSSHSTQCSAFAIHIISEYRLHCHRYSTCTGCWVFWRWYFNLPPSCCIFFFSSASSFIHHLFEYGLGVVSLTCFSMAFYIFSFRVLSLSLNSCILAISVGGGMLARLSFRVFTSSVQSINLKFCLSFHAVLGA
jgi:hypothetical protein